MLQTHAHRAQTYAHRAQTHAHRAQTYLASSVERATCLINNLPSI